MVMPKCGAPRAIYQGVHKTYISSKQIKRGAFLRKNDIQLYAWTSGVSVSTRNSKNLDGADNEQGSLRFSYDPSETIR